MGGFGIQYVLTANVPNPLPPFLETYAFNSQEILLTPGLARRQEHDLTLPFDEKIGNEFWNVDPVIGVRGGGISKRTLFNSGLAKTCTLDAAFEEPLNSNNPLFNGVQNLKIAIGAKDQAGNPCDGGTLRVSLMRCSDANCQNEPFTPQLVTSSAQAENIMAPAGKGKYVYNLDLGPVDTSGAEVTPAQFVLTVWGNIAQPKNQMFRVSKSSK
jgi:hypothetical protein